MSEFEVKAIRNGVTIVKYLGEEKEITIPDFIDGKKVVEISAKCFSRNKKVKKITISDNVRIVGDHAFSYCSSLKEVILPKNVEQLGEELFKGCGKLEYVYLDTTYTMTLDKPFIANDKFGFNVKIPKRLKIGEPDWIEELFEGAYILSNPEDNIITGYDIKYDCVNKKINKTKDGLYYFEIPEGIVITHGKKPYNFIDNEIVIPSEINNKPVVAIGCEAFKNSIFISLELPESIKTISAHAFVMSKFVYLKLPTELNYLNDNWIGDDFLNFNIKEFFSFKNDVDYSKIVVLPKIINDLDIHSLENRNYRFLFLNDTNYKVPENSSIVKNVIFDNKNNIIYTTNNQSITIISAYNCEKIQDLPISIDNLNVNGISSYVIQQLTKNVVSLNEDVISKSAEILENESTEINDKNEAINKAINNVVDAVEENKMFSFSKLNDELYIPDNIKHVYCFFDCDIDYREKNVIFPNDLKTLEGIDATNEAFILPKSVNKIDKVKGTIYLFNETKINKYSSEEAQIIAGIDLVDETDEYKYIVKDKEITLIKYIGNKDVATLPSTINGLPVKHALIKYGENVKRFIFDNIYYEYDEETNKKTIDISFKEKLDCFEIGGSVRSIRTIEELIPSYKTSKININEGLTEITGDNTHYFIIFTNNEPEDEENKVSIYLPKSLKHVGKKGLQGECNCYIYAHRTTKFDDGSVEDYAKIKYIDNYQEDVVDVEDDNYNITTNSEIIQKIINYDFSRVSENTMNKAKEVLNSNRFYDFNDEREDAVSIYYSGTVDEYYISISLNRNTGKLNYYCSCPSFHNGYESYRCKHIFGFILYIKEKYKNFTIFKNKHTEIQKSNNTTVVINKHDNNIPKNTDTNTNVKDCQINQSKGPWNKFAKIGNILGIISLLTMWIPFFTIYSTGIYAIVFSGLGMRSVDKKHVAKRSLGISIFAVIVNMIVTIITLASSF